MNPLKKLLCALFLLAISIGGFLVGCRIIDPGYGNSPDPVSASETIVEARVFPHLPFDFFAGIFRLSAPAQSFQEDNVIKIIRTYQAYAPITPPAGWTQLSDLYAIAPQKFMNRLQKPALLQIPFDPTLLTASSTLEDIFMGFQDSAGKWRFRVPSLDDTGNIAAIETSHFSTWAVFARANDGLTPFLKSTPAVTAEPRLLTSDGQGQSATDLIITVHLPSSANLMSLLSNGSLVLTLYPGGGRNFALTETLTGSSKRLLKLDFGALPALDLLRDPFVAKQALATGLGFSARLAFKGKPMDDVPRKIAWSLHLIDATQSTYVSEGEFSLEGADRTVTLLAPRGEIRDSRPTFRWMYSPAPTDFSRVKLQVAPEKRGFLLPALEKELDAVFTEYVPEASEAVRLLESQPFSWRLVSTDIDGRTRETEPLTFTILENPGPMTFIDSYPSSQTFVIPPDATLRFSFTRSIASPSAPGAFSLTPHLPGALDVQEKTLSFTPTAGFAVNASYVVRIATSLIDLGGFPLQQKIERRFSIASAAVLDQPRIVKTTPAALAGEVAINQALTLVFSQAMATATVEAALKLSPAAGVLTYAWVGDQTLTIESSGGLAYGTSYSLTVATAAKTLSGAALPEPFDLKFTTRYYVDSVKPRLVATLPASGATAIPRNTPLTVTFSESMNRASVQVGISITGLTLAAADFSWADDDSRVSVLPQPALWAAASNLAVTISSGCRDLSGNPLENPSVMTFTTSPETGPVLVKTIPENNSVAVPPVTRLAFTFDRAMNTGDTEKALTIVPDSNSGKSFEWSVDRKTLTVILGKALAEGVTTILSFSNSARDAGGIALAGTREIRVTVPDLTAPNILATLPQGGDKGVFINAPLRLTFSKPMNTGSLQAALTASPTLALNTPTWNASATEATITPLSTWPASTTVTITVARGVRDSSGNALANSYVLSFTTETRSAPTLISTVPGALATGVARDIKPVLTFDRAMNQATVVQALTITPPILPAPAFSWSADGKALTISPVDPLGNATLYTIALSTSAKDTAEIALSAPFSLGFTTTDTEAPTLVQLTPSANQTDVSTLTTIVFRFDKALNRASAQNAFSLTPADGGARTFTWLTDSTLQISLATALTEQTTYVVRLASAVADLAGNLLKNDIQASFRTVNSAPPVVVAALPTSGATGIPVNTQAVFTFNKTMNPATVQLSFSPNPGIASALWSDQNRVFTVTFAAPLTGNTTYSGTFAGAADTFNNALTGTTVFTFQTGIVTAPQVIAALPAESSTGVSLTPSLRFEFDKPMQTALVQGAFSIVPAVTGGPSFTWSADRKIATVTFATPLEFNTAYAATIGVGAKDDNTVALAQPFTRQFSTDLRPEVVAASVTPANGATAIIATTTISMTFSKSMRQYATQNAFSLQAGATSLAGTVAWSGNTLTFTPAVALQSAVTHQITVTTGAQDQQGYSLAAPFTSTFTIKALPTSSWTEIVNVDNQAFDGRIDAAYISFANYLWMIGGKADDGTYLNDVYRSTNGITWNQVLGLASSSSSRFSARTGHALAVVGTTLYLTGGESDETGVLEYLDDVWSTTNGTSWTRVSASAEYYARSGHAMLAFDNRLWILGGITEDLGGNPVLLDDAWSWQPGANPWIERSTNVPFPARVRASAMVLGNRMYITAGAGGVNPTSPVPLNDIFSSADGETWIQVTGNAPFPARSEAGSVYHNNLWYLIGGLGKSGSSEVRFNDIWTSPDGGGWTRLLVDEPGHAGHFSQRNGHGLVSLNNNLYIIGGEDINGSQIDVWTSP
jgi:hypothetical protein